MAENKTSFVLYSDSKTIIDMLSDEEAGKLLKTLFAYVNDENPEIDKSIAIVFQMIKLQLKRDLKKWESTVEGRSKAGKASAEARKLAKEAQQNSTNSTSVAFVQQIPTNPTDSVSVNVSVSDSVSDSVNENVNVIKKETTPLAIFTFSEFWSLYPHKVAKDKCEPKYEKLSNSDKVKIKSTLNNFLAIKPFAEYNHPNPLTYLNQKRWNDEVKKENSTFAPANPENEEIVTYYDNVNPTRRQITRSKFELMKVRNAEGGYIYSEIPQR